MASSIDKSKIIAAINETEDERILFAISRLLQLEENDDIPDWHKEILTERMKDISAGKVIFHDWDDIKEEIKKID